MKFLSNVHNISLPALSTTSPLTPATQPPDNTTISDGRAPATQPPDNTTISDGRATNGSNAGAIAGGLIVVIIALVTVAMAVVFLLLWFVLKHIIASNTLFHVLYTQEEAFNSIIQSGSCLLCHLQTQAGGWYRTGRYEKYI